jgi:NADPH:quinone reductase-like Zn-dependent oxidoreductase
MKAMKVNNAQQGAPLIATTLPQPQPADGEVLIRVRAVGVTPTELLWYPTSHTRDGKARTNAVPGHEFSGSIAALGKSVTGFSVGDEVYGMNDWFADGATAEFCLTQPQDIAPKPKTLTHEFAAAVPIGALTAWQGLFDRAHLDSGERVLIHGAAGAVGVFATQLARRRGAYVIATASTLNMEFVKQLGADEVIDYKTSDFEDQVKNVDVAFDVVGGETLDRSWAVLKAGGRMVAIAADSGDSTDQRVKDAFFIVEPDRKRLDEITKLLDAGVLKAFLSAVVPFGEASAAYSRAVPEKHAYGKVVISIGA